VQRLVVVHHPPSSSSISHHLIREAGDRLVCGGRMVSYRCLSFSIRYSLPLLIICNFGNDGTTTFKTGLYCYRSEQAGSRIMIAKIIERTLNDADRTAIMASARGASLCLACGTLPTNQDRLPLSSQEKLHESSHMLVISAGIAHHSPGLLYLGRDTSRQKYTTSTYTYSRLWYSSIEEAYSRSVITRWFLMED
jgi:hypothetical protein